MANNRKMVDFAKELLVKGKKDELVSAKLAVKFGGKHVDYYKQIQQAKKEISYTEEARRAITEHIELGGGFDRRPDRFARLVFNGPSHPMCPFVAIRMEVEKVISKWQEESILSGPSWRRRVNFAKDALEDSAEIAEVEALYRARYSDNPILIHKVLSVAKRELSRDADNFASVLQPKKTDHKEKKAKKRAMKKARQNRDQKRIKLIFGLNTAT